MTFPALAPIGVVGSHELDYPRNIVLQSALRKAGYELIVCHSRDAFPKRHASLAQKFFNLPPEVRVIYVTEGGHRLVPLLKAWCLMTGRRLVFDPFLSRYNTRVEDRMWFKPGTPHAWMAHYQDWSACKCADHLIFDTEEHKEYFTER